MKLYVKHTYIQIEIGMAMPNDVIYSDIACVHDAVYFLCVYPSLYLICLIIPGCISVAFIYLSIFAAIPYAFAVNGLMAMVQAWGPQGNNILQWSGTDPCGSRWTGITCDNSSPQRVTEM